MHRMHFAALFCAALGTVVALVALAAPFGNTGVDGTLGATLAFVGTLAVTLAIVVMMARPLSRRWFIIINALAALAALLTAIAAFFLMQTFLTFVMAATLLIVVFAFFVHGRSSVA